MTSSDDRLAAALRAAQENFETRGGTASGRKRERQKARREWTRAVIKTDRLDLIEWHGNQDEQHAWYTSDPVVGVRSDPEVDSAINDLFYGDLGNQDERPGYLNGPELMQDIFFSFLLPVPKMRKKSEIEKDARLNGKFLQQLHDLPVFEEIRDYSITDPDTAKGAMLALVDVVKEMIKQHREAVEEANQQRQEAGCDPGGQPGNSDRENWDEETPQSGDSEGQGQGESGGAGDTSGKSQFGESGADREDEPDWDHREDSPGEDEDRQEAGSGSEEHETDGSDDPDRLDDNEREFNEDLDGEYDEETAWEAIADQMDFGRMANSTLQHFADEQEDLRDAVSGIGVSPEEWKLMDPAKRLALAKRLNNPKMRKLGDLVGRMKRFALTRQAQKVNDTPHEIYTIEQGNDLHRIVLSEYALLGTPETKLYFYLKFANGELLQYKKRGQENVGKGPLIVCVDNSGSMGGDPEDWAKAVAEALRRVAADQDRDFYVMFFEVNSHRERFDFPKGKGPFEKVMAYLSITAGGGTQFDGVLTEALQKAVDFGEGQPEHGKSDIVFITDGQCHLDQGWIDKFNVKRQEAGVRVFSIYISAYDSERSSAMRLLESFSDVTIPVKALDIDDRTTSELFATI